MCPILAFGVHILSNSSFSRHVFPNDDNSQAFSNWLSVTLRVVDQRLLNAIGVGNIKDVGVHAATYCSSIPGGPALASLFQRVGWSVGEVADVYLQTIGRLIYLLLLKRFWRFPFELKELIGK